MAMAAGEFVFFLDHDDYIFPEALQRMYDFAAAHELDVLYPKEIVRGWGSPGWSAWRDQVPVLHSLPQHVLQCITPHKLYRRRFLVQHKITFPDELRRLEDFAFNGHALVHADRVGVLADYPCSAWIIGDSNAHKSGYDFDHYWLAFERSLRPIVEELPPGDRQDQLLVRWYRSRLLERLQQNLGEWSAGYRKRVFAMFGSLLRYFPDRLDALLLPADRARSALLRAGDQRGLQALFALDSGLRLVCHTATQNWRDGKLVVELAGRLLDGSGSPVPFVVDDDGRIRRRVGPDLVGQVPPETWDVTAAVASAFVEFVARDRDTAVDWILPTEHRVEVVDGALTFWARTEVDPQGAAWGAALPDGVEDLYFRLEGLGYTATQHVPHGGRRHRPAFVAGRPLVAYRTSANHLALDVGSHLHSMVDLASTADLQLVPDASGALTMRGAQVHVHGGPARWSGAMRVGGVRRPAELIADAEGTRISLRADSGVTLPPPPAPPEVVQPPAAPVAPRPVPAARPADALDRIGRRHGIDQASDHHDYLRTYQRELDAIDPRRIVIVSGQTPDRVARVFAEFYPDAVVHLLTVRSPIADLDLPNVRQAHCPTVADLNRYLLGIPAPDAIIEDGTNASSHKVRCFRALFLHLRSGGLYLAEDLHAHHLERFRDEEEGVWQYVAKLLEVRSHPRPAELAADPRAGVHRDDLARAEAISRVTNYGKLAVVERVGDHLVKVKDDVLTAVLASRLGPERSSELFTRPTAVVTPKCSLWVSKELVSSRFHPSAVVPELYARLYHDVVCGPRQLVQVGDVVPAIAFHHPLGKRLGSKTTVDVSPDVTRLRKPLGTPRRLAGTYYHLDSEFPGHFGHFMTEDLGRLWGWREAKQRFPGLKILLSTERKGGELAAFQQTLLHAYDIADDDVVVIDRPVRVEQLVGVSPMFHNGKYVHPELTRVWSDLSTRLVPDPGPSVGKLFVSRSAGLQRTCHDGAEVEALFRSAGFTVLLPEQLPLLEQARLFAEAQVVAGYGGSGLFGSIFARQPGTRIVIAAETYNATNEWLIAGAQGGAYHHFYGRADLSHPKNGWSVEAFHSNFTFDVGRNGSALRRLLRRL
jgi:capsular polysaccharide biosynthesis protein